MPDTGDRLIIRIPYNANPGYNGLSGIDIFQEPGQTVSPIRIFDSNANLIATLPLGAGSITAAMLPSDVAFTDAANNFSVDQKITIRDSATSSETQSLLFTHSSTGTPSTGFGTGVEFGGDDSANVNRRMGKLAVSWKVATSGSQSSQIELYAANSSAYVPVITADGSQNVFIPGNFSHTGLAGTNTFGIFNTTPVIQQANASQAAITAVTDANAKSALQALYNLCKNYGFAPATA